MEGPLFVPADADRAELEALRAGPLHVLQQNQQRLTAPPEERFEHAHQSNMRGLGLELGCPADLALQHGGGIGHHPGDHRALERGRLGQEQEQAQNAGPWLVGPRCRAQRDVWTGWARRSSPR